LQRLS